MNLLIRRLQIEWPSWLAVAFIALLPFHRLAEIPLSVFALSLPFLARSAENRRRMAVVMPFLVPLFLCFWLPMVLSSFDSFLPEKSWLKSLAALRFLAAALSMAVLLNTATARWRVLRWTAYLLVFWAVDGFIQLFFGNDLFGIAMHPDRLNALFIKKYQFFGPTLAILSPLLLEYARRRWPAWAWAASFTLILGAVMIAGMRSGWLVMAIVLTTYLIMIRSRENRDLRTVTLSIPVLAVLMIVASYLVSPLVQQRLDLTMSVVEGTEAALDYASSKRVPIFKTSYRMYRAHPVNGVGVRAFPIAYLDYADPDDIHVQEAGGARGATHAHNVVLEVMADTGTIGLAGYLMLFVLAWKTWRSMLPAHRQEAFPYALSLLLVLFPLNSYFAIYGAYTSSLIWILVGLWAATFPDDRL